MANLNTTINEQKTIVSNHTLEFAKLIGLMGIKLSPFPIVGLYKTINSPLNVANLLVFNIPT